MVHLKFCFGNEPLSESEAESSGSHSRGASPNNISLTRSRSNSPQNSQLGSGTSSSNHSDSPSPLREKKTVIENNDSKSQSPNLQIDDRTEFHNRSISHSRSPSRTHSRSLTPSHSKCDSTSRSGTPLGSSSKGHMQTAIRSRSGSRSKSQTPSKILSNDGSAFSHSARSSSKSSIRSHSGSRSRSISPELKGKQVESGNKIIEQSKNGKKANVFGENDDMPVTKKRKVLSRIIDSESDSDCNTNIPKIDAQDIFGDADDISLSDDDEELKSPKVGGIDVKQGRQSRSKSRSRSKSKASSKSSSKSRSQSRSRYRSRSRSRSRSLRSRSRTRSCSAERVADVQQKEDEIEIVPETRIDVEIPRIITDLGREIHFVKLPNFLSVETRPFDQETYEDEIDEEETMDEEGRQRIKLKVSNTIRWREFMNNNGGMVKESNARFVRWSDGSMSLHLGNEIFDVYRQPLHGDHNHMFIRQGTGLQGQAVFRTKLTFRPHSTESFTHKKMTMSLADRSQKVSGIKILTQVGKDPTADRLYHLKKEEEKLRQAIRSQHRPQVKPKKKSSVEMNATYHHDDASEDENAISLSAIKNQYKKGHISSSVSNKNNHSQNRPTAIYSSDEDEGSDFEGRRFNKGINKAKVLQALRDSDDESDVHDSAKNSSSESGSNSQNDNSDEASNVGSNKSDCSDNEGGGDGSCSVTSDQN